MIRAMVNTLPASDRSMHFLEANRTQGDDGHVECVDESPPLNAHVAERPQEHEQEKHYHRYFKMSDRIHDGRRLPAGVVKFKLDYGSG